jgi:ubiquinone biosynthesis monooxygenase Coq7
MAKRKTQKKSPKRAPKKREGMRLPGDLNEREALERILRVDHAGEFGAQRIYAGQMSVLGNTKAGPVIAEMAAQEDEHLAAFEDLLREHKVRPTALYPLWHVAGFALGAITARLGEKAAMACTVAVEEVIDEHYAKQLQELKSNPKLKKMIAKFREDELHHRDIGLEHQAEDFPQYGLLRALVRAGSKTAIWLSERV